MKETDTCQSTERNREILAVKGKQRKIDKPDEREREREREEFVGATGNIDTILMSFRFPRPASERDRARGCVIYI
jgi:hypothetical protein